MNSQPRPYHDVLVSAGGGAFGGALMEAAVSAAAQDIERSWLVSTGPNLPESDCNALDARLPKNATLTRYISNLAEQMKH